MVAIAMEWTKDYAIELKDQFLLNYIFDVSWLYLLPAGEGIFN